MVRLLLKSAGALLVLCFALSSCQLPFSDEAVNCDERSYQGMSADELAAAVGLPVLKIGGLPSHINPEPTIGLAIYYPLESAVCGLDMRYFSGDEDADTLTLSIRIFSSDGQTTDWSCIDFASEHENDPKHPQSMCSGTVDVDGNRLFILIDSFMDADVTLATVQALEWSR